MHSTSPKNQYDFNSDDEYEDQLQIWPCPVFTESIVGMEVPPLIVQRQLM